MTTKLTLSVDAQIIAAAKEAAKEQGVSISSAVTGFLKDFSKKGKRENKEIRPDVAALYGVVKLSDDLDYREIATEMRLKKYDL